MGIDVGEDRPKGGFFKGLVDTAAEHGIRIMQSVHGLYVYERQGNEVFPEFSAIMAVTMDPSKFFEGLAASFQEIRGIGEREQTALALIALSKTAREPLAEAVLCISAVEYLSRDEPWTSAQCKLLAKLQAEAAASAELPKEEAKEVAKAIEPVFRSGVLQSKLGGGWLRLA
jgi:hypothetical protein